ncbi:MAG: CRTAC1 family protein [Saprospiraceae bacterium]|nr:CRTAC1 family protein [Saprospiraceae bacterium]
MKNKTLQIIGFQIVILLAIGCGGGKTNEEFSSASSEKTSGKGTAGMVKLLQEAYAKIDPMQVPFYSNSLRAQHFKSQMESGADPSQQFVTNLQYAYELLSAGKNEQAVVEFEKLLDAVNQSGGNPKYVYQVKKLLALSYIRLGEASNCIDRYNDQSCLMPIQGKGVYTVTESSRSAIQLYESMLKEQPEDYETIWMLNFAYMTLGEYPQKVPKQWLIPASSFKSDFDLPPFKNIASKIGVGTVGLSGGACVEDFNNDGLLDIIASSWGVKDQLRFYVNNGDGSFTEKTREAGLTGLTGGLNTNHTDYNNDGFMDVFVMRGAWYEASGKIPNSLLKNNGDGTFTDVTVEAGLLSYAPTQASVWADFNLDGWLDLFIGNESGQGFTNPCEFYINNHDGTFTNRINEMGLGGVLAYIKGCAAGDVNNDGWPDLYISTLNSSNLLLINNGITADGLVSFQDATRQAGVGEPVVGVPCWMFDFNNDGWEDIMATGFGVPDGKVAAYLATLNFKGQFAGGNPHLYINNGDSTFRDIYKAAGLDEAMFVMGSNYGDLDNDGWLDCYFGTGAPGLTAIVPNKMFRNNQGKTFQDVTTTGGFGHLQKGHGVGFGDFDNDGDQDIFAVIGGAMEGDVFGDAFFLNPIGNRKSWINLKLIGTTSNRAAIGARVKLTVVNKGGVERSIYNTVSTGGSFGGNSLALEVGLDDAVKIKELEIRWPNATRTVSTYNNVEIDRFVKITEGVEQLEYLNPKSFDFLQ